MRAFVAVIVVMILLGLGAHFGLKSLDMTTANSFSSPNVRL